MSIPTFQPRPLTAKPGRLPGPGRVLVVDDSAEVRDGLDLLLSIEGCEVKGAGTPEAAIEILASWQPDLILIDLLLAGADSRDLLRAYRQLPGPHAPAILLTGHQVELTEDLLTMGVVDILPKPFELDRLLDVIDEHAPCLRRR